MTATHDRRRDPRARVNALQEWGQRSVFGAARGWPWWGAVLLALGLSIVGAFIDMHFSGNLSKVFEGAYFLGCVGAVCLVRRRSVFGPMVEPPLILAVTIPVVVLLTKGMPAGSGLTAKLLALGVPLVTGFPTMAITTGATVVIGGIRYLAQRKPIILGADEWDDDLDARGEPRRRPANRGAAERGAGRDGGRERASSGRPRPGNGSGGRPASGRSSRDEPGSPRERGRASQSGRGRGEPSGRDERSGRSGADRGRAQGRDVERRGSRDRGEGGQPSREGGQPSRSQGRERGQAPRGGGRPSRDDGRRQPPRHRDEDR